MTVLIVAICFLVVLVLFAGSHLFQHRDKSLEHLARQEKARDAMRRF